MKKLITGELSLDDEYLQKCLLDWMQSEDCNIFKNRETGDIIYATVCKRGNKVYATRKAKKKDEILNALEGKEFDIPVKGFRNRRRTKMLFITINFDREQFSKECAWAALRSTDLEGVDYTYNVINDLEANLRSIFGPHSKLVCKEAQESGYPAPHLILLLDEYVDVELFKGRTGPSWRLCDPRVLKRIGKEKWLRNLSFTDHRQAMELNPIWKYGFIDIEGIIKGKSYNSKHNGITYPFKYLTKCVTGDNSTTIKHTGSINELSNKHMKTLLFTHMGNKCFRTRDLSFSKDFMNRLGVLKIEEPKSESLWIRLRSIPKWVVDLEIERLKRKAMKEGSAETPPS